MEQIIDWNFDVKIFEKLKPWSSQYENQDVDLNESFLSHYRCGSIWDSNEIWAP